MRRFILHILILAFILARPVLAGAQKVSYEEIVRGNLKKMTKHSGTFDLYDGETEKVRNLRMIEILPDIREEGKNAYVPVRFRDISSGDIVLVEVKITMISEGRFDSHWSIKEVQGVKNDEKKKESYTDAEVQQVMKDYIAKQSKFTGHVTLFDQKTQKMRTLDLTELGKEVRRYGILSISTARFLDVESQEKLEIDINVKNNKGKLEVESLKIKKVKK